MIKRGNINKMNNDLLQVKGIIIECPCLGVEIICRDVTIFSGLSSDMYNEDECVIIKVKCSCGCEHRIEH